MSDLEARERAAHGYDENFVVVAGAGTGKTSLLVERILCQMVERELGSDQLVAITFTEKAAAEMRKRLEAGLARLAANAAADRPAAELAPGAEADRAFAWLRERGQTGAAIAKLATERLHALPETEVTTIHGFCARLLRRFPVEAGVDPDFQVDTGGRLAELVEELWERFLAGPDGLEGARSERFARVLERLWLGELAALARGVAAFALPEGALDAAAAQLARRVRELDRVAARRDRLGLQRPARAGSGELARLGAAAPRDLARRRRSTRSSAPSPSATTSGPTEPAACSTGLLRPRPRTARRRA